MTSVVWPALLTGAALAVATCLPRAEDVRLGLLVQPVPDVARTDPLPAVATTSLSALLVLGVGAWSGSVVALLLVAAAALAGRLAWRRSASRRARTTERLRAGEACLALAAELRAGRAPADALATAAQLALGRTRQALQDAAAAARLGGDVPSALLAPAAGSAAPEVLRGLAACWQVCSRAGSGLAAAVDRLADGLRAALAQERAVESALAGPRTSAALLALLPLAGIALAAALGARPAHVLLHTPLGVSCLVGGCLLDVLGLWWTARLVDRAGRAR